MKFFLQKQLIKLSCTYQPFSFCKIFKKFLEPIQSYEMCHFQAQNGPFILHKFFWYKLLLLLSSTCWTFLLCKILKKFLQLIQSYEDAPFLGPKSSICHKQIFFGKKYSHHFYLPIDSFHCVKFEKNSSSKSRLMTVCHLGAQNGPFAQIRIFSLKTC